MVGYRNRISKKDLIKQILSGIPMVGYRNAVKVGSDVRFILSGIPMVGYRNPGQLHDGGL